jgi:hypothetical protein
MAAIRRPGGVVGAIAIPGAMEAWGGRATPPSLWRRRQSGIQACGKQVGSAAMSPAALPAVLFDIKGS